VGSPPSRSQLTFFPLLAAFFFSFHMVSITFWRPSAEPPEENSPFLACFFGKRPYSSFPSPFFRGFPCSSFVSCNGFSASFFPLSLPFLPLNGCGIFSSPLLKLFPRRFPNVPLLPTFLLPKLLFFDFFSLFLSTYFFHLRS